MWYHPYVYVDAASYNVLLAGQAREASFRWLQLNSSLGRPTRLVRWIKGVELSKLETVIFHSPTNG
jgi:hypothetical protein